MTADHVIKAGFWMQLVLLGMLDIGTIAVFASEPVAAYHYVGFVAVNVGLIGASVWMWRWMSAAREA